MGLVLDLVVCNVNFQHFVRTGFKILYNKIKCLKFVLPPELIKFEMI